MRLKSITIEEAATPVNFAEADYLAANPDVAEAVLNGTCSSGRLHFQQYGRQEGRRIRRPTSIAQLQQEKIRRLEPLMLRDLPHLRSGARYDFRTDEARVQVSAADIPVLSAADYQERALELIERFADGWILDCGAGKRPVYYSNVVNYDVADYESTDILGTKDALPFTDNAFDAVLALSGLEHAQDPFAFAAEIARVLKPGGILVCAAPFLQPAQRHPEHYFNMTGEGLRALFEQDLEIDEQIAPPSGPVQALVAMAQQWVKGLTGRAREEFLAMRIQDLLRTPGALHNRRWVRELAREKSTELAHTTIMIAHKPHRPTA